MKNIRPCEKKTLSELALEWDKIAEERHAQIASGQDLSFDHVLVPAIFSLLTGANTGRVLDIGSGTGDFTARLARVAVEVIGIEPSRRCVALARTNCPHLSNLRFIEASVEEASGILTPATATAAVACMTLMTTPDLTSFANAVGSLLQKEAKLVATLSHPWFWPRYWGYETEPWFSYLEETFIEAPFVISRRQTEIRTTHIHRPLEQYLHTFAEAGFGLEALIEPMPSPDVEALYPQWWRFPRFMGLRWAKVT
jgi:SAM-dependent methyltransferase